MSVISGRTDTVVAAVRVGSEPLGVATDPRAKAIYVTNNGGNTVPCSSPAADEQLPAALPGTCRGQPPEHHERVGRRL